MAAGEVHEQRDIETIEAERVGETSVPGRSALTGKHTVIAVDDVVGLSVEDLAIARIGAVDSGLVGFIELPYALRVEQVKFPERVPHEKRFIDILLAVVKLDNLVAVIGDVERRGPLKITQIQIDRVQR